MEKTNVMRVLDRCKVRYESHCYLSGEDFSPENAPSGVEVAAVLGIDVARVFKTLVTVGKSLNHYVFVIPVASELDLKKQLPPSAKNPWKCSNSAISFPSRGTFTAAVPR